MYDIVYLLREQNFQGKQLLDTIQRYRITYLPQHIIQLIEAKKEDPFDTEGIENPRMDLTEYDELKSYLLQAIVEE